MDPGFLFCTVAALLLSMVALFRNYQHVALSMVRHNGYLRFHITRISLNQAFYTLCTVIVAGAVLWFQWPTFLSIIQGPVQVRFEDLPKINVDETPYLQVDASGASISRSGQWHSERLDWAKGQRIHTSGPILVITGGGTQDNALTVRSRSHNFHNVFQGMAISPESAEVMIHPNWLQFVLDETDAIWYEVMLFLGVGTVVAGCFLHLYQLWAVQNHPEKHPLIRALAPYVNHQADGTLMDVMDAIDSEVEQNVQGAVEGHESDLILTDSWLLHCRASTLEVAFFPDIVKMEPLYNFTPEGRVLLGLQIFCRRGSNFFVALSEQQFQTIEAKLSQRLSIAEVLRNQQVLQEQLTRLRRRMDITRDYLTYTVDRSDDDAMTQCCACDNDVEVKINKRCTPEMWDAHDDAHATSTTNVCVDRRDCFCEPSMCSECIAKWFKDADHATCPTCRIPFCMWDVVPVVFGRRTDRRNVDDGVDAQ
eukprot:GFYU01005431.1.p1 GENE.GFYU01005431.1~~GFYU01005431.1.p1  ORF type:complete len:479 (-),score=92.83 GFYU01005431.1:383-1819(-)